MKIPGTSAVLDSDEIEYSPKVLLKETLLEHFKLAEFVEVKISKTRRWYFKSSLFRNVPDAMKPKRLKYPKLCGKYWGGENKQLL